VVVQLIAQVEHDALADEGVQVALQHADEPAGDAEAHHGADHEVEEVRVLVGDRLVEDAANAQGGEHAQAGGGGDAQEDDQPPAPVGQQVAAGALDLLTVELHGRPVQTGLGGPMHSVGAPVSPE